MYTRQHVRNAVLPWSPRVRAAGMGSIFSDLVAKGEGAVANKATGAGGNVVSDTGGSIASSAVKSAIEAVTEKNQKEITTLLVHADGTLGHVDKFIDWGKVGMGIVAVALGYFLVKRAHRKA